MKIKRHDTPVKLAYQYHSARGMAHGQVMLVAGLGLNTAFWPEALITSLNAAGFDVVAPDNRDIGRSPLLNHLGRPPLIRLAAARKLGIGLRPPYDLFMMAGDLLHLVDELELETFHVIGLSMGGMIAQLTASMAPDRVRSLTSIMSTTGEAGLPRPSRDVTRLLLRKPRPDTPDGRLAHALKMWQKISSPAYPRDDSEWLSLIMKMAGRGLDPEGIRRQLAGIIGPPGWTEELRMVIAPTLVIHGSEDPLVPLSGGEATARAIAGARLRVFEGMGHDLPEPLLPEITAEILRHINQAQGIRITRQSTGRPERPIAEKNGKV